MVVIECLGSTPALIRKSYSILDRELQEPPLDIELIKHVWSGDTYKEPDVDNLDTLIQRLVQITLNLADMVIQGRTPAGDPTVVSTALDVQQQLRRIAADMDMPTDDTPERGIMTENISMNQEDAITIGDVPHTHDHATHDVVRAAYPVNHRTAYRNELDSPTMRIAPRGTMIIPSLTFARNIGETLLRDLTLHIEDPLREHSIEAQQQRQQQQQQQQQQQLIMANTHTIMNWPMPPELILAGAMSRTLPIVYIDSHDTYYEMGFPINNHHASPINNHRQLMGRTHRESIVQTNTDIVPYNRYPSLYDDTYQSAVQYILREHHPVNIPLIKPKHVSKRETHKKKVQYVKHKTRSFKGGGKPQSFKERNKVPIMRR